MRKLLLLPFLALVTASQAATITLDSYSYDVGALSRVGTTNQYRSASKLTISGTIDNSAGTDYIWLFVHINQPFATAQLGYAALGPGNVPSIKLAPGESYTGVISSAYIDAWSQIQGDYVFGALGNFGLNHYSEGSYDNNSLLSWGDPGITWDVDGSFSVPVTAAPEPASMAALGLGCAAITRSARRRSRRAVRA